MIKSIGIHDTTTQPIKSFNITFCIKFNRTYKIYNYPHIGIPLDHDIVASILQYLFN